MRSSAPLLPAAAIGRVLETLADEYDSDVHMEGGEVFLRSDLKDVFARVPERCWSIVTITTGGAAKIDVPFEKLRLLQAVRVSVEGHTDDLQRRIRLIPLQPVLRTCDLLQTNGVTVTLVITLYGANYGVVPEMIDFFAARGLTRFSLFEMQPVGRGVSLDPAFFLSDDALRRALVSLNDIPLHRVTSFRLGLKASRIPLVEEQAPMLRSRGFAIERPAETPSLTINSDGTIGSSAWQITAAGVADRAGVVDPATFSCDLQRLLGSGALSRRCEYTSSVVISYPRS